MCNCGNPNSSPSTSTSVQRYEVKLPSGQTEIVNSEHEARVAVTRAGGGTFSRI